jgi:FkbH-like protein
MIIYKNSIAINCGYNEEKIVIPDTIYQKSLKNGSIEVYPEDNINAEMTIYFFGLVKLFPLINKEKNENKKIKCVVWDLDKTLWDGILIESDPSKICLRDGVLKVIKTLDERGILQSIVSKNNEDEAMAALQRLGIDQYFLYPMINWNPKSLNIKKIAELLNIDVNSFAFIDDSSFERAEVSSNLPDLKIYDETIIEAILDLPETKITITEESRIRRSMYQTEAKRKDIQQEAFADNYIDFLKNCNIQIHIEKPYTEELIARSFELIQRTNQLNLSGKKYNKTEFNALLQKEGVDTYIVRCEDRYGTYGYIAFFTVKKERTQLYIDEFAMSCRVAKKYVESGIIFWLEKKYGAIDTVNLCGFKTQKNDLLISSFRDIGFQVDYNEEKFSLSIAKSDSLKNSGIIEVNHEC